MFKLKKIAGLVSAGLFAAVLLPSLVLADPGDWQVSYRNSDDSAYIPLNVPLRATSTAALLGGVAGSDSATWYYIGTCFSVDNLGFDEGYGFHNNYKVNVDTDCVTNHLNLVSNLGYVADMAGKASTSSVASLTTTVNALGVPFNIAAFMVNQASTTPYDATSTFNGFMSSSDKSKLNGLPTTADVLGQATSSAAAAQAYAIQRSNQTGTQAASTITGLSTVATSGSYADLTNKPTISAAYEGTTLRTGAFPIFKSATVGSGVATFNLTNDGLSTGTALCPNGVIQDSVNVTFNDASSSYQQSWAFTNSNKTLTVTANKFTTANILSGILGQAAANAAVAKLTVWCY